MDKKKSVAATLGLAAGLGGARLGDLALIGGGVATAASAVAFAGYMTLAGGGERQPLINGMQYLAIFAQPSHTSRTGLGIDEAPLGAIPKTVKDHVAGYALVGAQSSFAWLREGNRIFSVRPGETVPRLGRVAEIAQREGRWALIDDKGEPLLVSSLIELAPAPDGTRFDKRMIFGDNP